MWSPGPIIVGAGPAGLATAACLKKKGIPSTIIERSTCIASLWQLRTYDRLRLHLPKHFCELPFMPFPSEYPIYPTKQQFLEYLESYAREFEIKPRFNENVEMARFDKEMGLWRVWTVEEAGAGGETKKKKRCSTYASRWLVVATGENAEAVVPEIEGLGEFVGPKMHTSLYRNGDGFKGRRVLVVGCGNSGMEVCLDLCNYGANPALVVRDSVHVLPQQVLGCSTFWLSSSLLKWLPVRTVDRFLLFMSWLVFGNTSQFGLKRPDLGPLELKSVTGKTPVLDVGAVAKIRSGHIKVFPAVKKFTGQGAEFVDGNTENFDALVLATGYRSNVPSWLKEREMFSEKDGFPKGWKGKQGLYAVGFRRRGILGASMDAKQVAQDILRSFLFSCSPNK